MRLELIPWPGPDAPTASTLRERLEHDGFSVFQWTDDARAHYSPHSHDHDESIWVVSGEITFGPALTFAGGQLLVGARFDDTAADDAGAAYLLDPVTGALVATLEAPSAAASDQLGSAVAALGGDLFIGAPHFNDSGAAHAGTV